MVQLTHFCQCSAGCAEATLLGMRYCERHSEELFALEVAALVDLGCPRCGLPGPEGLHLHRCSTMHRRSRHAALAKRAMAWGARMAIPTRGRSRGLSDTTVFRNAL